MNRAPRLPGMRPERSMSEAAQAILAAHQLSIDEGTGQQWISIYSDIQTDSKVAVPLLELLADVEVIDAGLTAIINEKATSPVKLRETLAQLHVQLLAMQTKIPPHLLAMQTETPSEGAEGAAMQTETPSERESKIKKLKNALSLILNGILSLQQALEAAGREDRRHQVLFSLSWMDVFHGSDGTPGPVPLVRAGLQDLEEIFHSTLLWHFQSRRPVPGKEPMVEVRVLPGGRYGGHSGPGIVKYSLIEDQAEAWMAVGEGAVLTVSASEFRRARSVLLPVDPEKAHAALPNRRSRPGGKRGRDRNVALEYLFCLVELAQGQGLARCGSECGKKHIPSVLAALIFLGDVEDTGRFDRFKKSLHTAYERFERRRSIQVRNSGGPPLPRRT